MTSDRDRAGEGVPARDTLVVRESERARGPSRPRIPVIDVARGVSILLVVFYHVTLFSEGFAPVVRPYELFNLLAGPVRMPLFFFVSGALSASVVRYSGPDLFSKRLWRLIYLFVVWVCIVWVYRNTVLVAMLGTDPVPVGELLFSFVDPPSTLWFILALCLYTLAVWASRDRLLVPIAVGVALYFTSFALGDALSWAQASMTRYFLFFYVGARYGRTLLGTLDEDILKWLGFGLLFLPIAAAALLVDERDPLIYLIRLALSVTAVPLLVCACGLLAHARPLSNAFSYLGRHTLSIYVLHTLLAWPVLSASYGVLRPLDMNGAIVVIPAVTLAITAASIAIRALLDRTMLRRLFEAPPAPGPRRAGG